MSVQLASDACIVHVLRHPAGGALAVVRELAGWQRRELKTDIRVLVLGARGWLDANEGRLRNSLPCCDLVPEVGNPLLRLAKDVFFNPIEKYLRSLPPRKTYLVHFHLGLSSAFLMPVAAPRRNSRVFHFSTFHGVGLRQGRPLSPRRLLSGIKRWIYARKPVCTIYCSGRLTRETADAIGLPAEKIVGIQNGTEPARLTGCPYVRRHHNTFTVGYAGHFSDAKGWSIAADSVLSLRERGYDVRLLLAGYGGAETRVKELAKENPLAIQFVGYVENPIESFWPEVDASILLSVTEGLPMSLLESLSAGVPAIATDVGGISELVIDGVTGYLVERDKAAAEEAILALITNRDLTSRMSAECVNRHRERFSVEAMGRNYRDIYYRMIARDGEPEAFHANS